jgi:branched-chain amino acid transport system ATP-binding protein
MEIGEGEIVALIGLNGAGKTTLIRVITRQLPLLHGDVQWQGESITRVHPHQVTDLGIAQCLEGRKIFPEMTVQENLQLGAYCRRGRVHRDETLRRIFELFPVLAERRDQLGSTLSGGEQQMLAIGRALMARPDLIIFDEISLGLAPVVIDQLYTAIEQINREGTTVLLVEQSVERSLDTAHRAYVIERGRIALSGPAEELRADPQFRRVYFGL